LFRSAPLIINLWW